MSEIFGLNYNCTTVKMTFSGKILHSRRYLSQMTKWEERSTNTCVSAGGEKLHWPSSAKRNPKQ